MLYMNTDRAFHYSFKGHKAHSVHLVNGGIITVQARSAREATDMAAADGHDVVVSVRTR